MSQHAYWITPTGIILRPAIRHIGTIIRCPEAFGETEEAIKVTCDRFGEKMSSTFEGKARNEILARVIRRGFIRIRKEMTRRFQHWSIQCHHLTPTHHAAISCWAGYIMAMGLDPVADVVLHCLHDNTTTAMSLRELAAASPAMPAQHAVLSEEDFCAGANHLSVNNES